MPVMMDTMHPFPLKEAFFSYVDYTSPTIRGGLTGVSDSFSLVIEEGAQDAS